MVSESYAQLLGKLGDALRSWALALFYDERLHGSIDNSFDQFIDDARTGIIVKLGAERRDSLAAPIEARLNRVKEQSKAFAAACSDARPRGQRQSLKGVTQRRIEMYLGHRVSFPPAPCMPQMTFGYCLMNAMRCSQISTTRSSEI